jgi:hypothetical protein
MFFSFPLIRISNRFPSLLGFVFYGKTRHFGQNRLTPEKFTNLPESGIAASDDVKVLASEVGHVSYQGSVVFSYQGQKIVTSPIKITLSPVARLALIAEETRGSNSSTSASTTNGSAWLGSAISSSCFQPQRLLLTARGSCGMFCGRHSSKLLTINASSAEKSAQLKFGQ